MLLWGVVGLKNKMENKPFCILSSGDDPYTSTGYGQIWEHLLKRWVKLKPDWKFYHIGWQNRDREHQTKEGYYMLPIQKVEYGFDTVLPYLMRYKPDIFLTMADVGITSGFIDGVAQAKQEGWRGRWFAINLVDTESWEHLLWNKILDVPDIVITAKNGEILYNKHNIKNVIYLPFGVDTKVYTPLEEKEKLKEKFKFKDRFIIGFVGKNQRRKTLPTLLKSFANFAKDKKDVNLLLHTDAESPTGWSVPCLIAKYEVEIDPELQKPNPKIIFTNPKLDVLTRQHIQPKMMNEIYNLMDVYCQAVGGEGFGLPVLEAQSAGLPTLMTNYSSAVEVIGDKELLIPILKDAYGRPVVEIGNNGVENAIPDDTELSKLFNKLYEEWKNSQLKKRGEKAREFALAAYDWDLIAPKWIKLFEQEG